MSLRYLDTTEPLDRFFQIKAQIAELEEELNELKPLITAALMEEPDQRTIYAGHELTLGTRRVYEYPEEIKEMERHLKAAKDYAKATGDAVVTRWTTYPVAKALPETKQAA